jgi:CheY-like chemotaxis protein
MADVLVVDDDVATRVMLRAALEDAGHGVSEARDGAEALDILRASPQALVVALDMLMPHGDGPSVLRAVRDEPLLATRHRYLAMTAVPITHLDLPTDLSRLLVRPVVAKPFRLGDFLAAVDEAANTQTLSR